MTYTHVIFDLDGTLLNTLEDLARAGNHVCETFCWPTFPLERYRYKVGNGIERLIERIMPAEFVGDARVARAALDAFRTYYDAHKEDHTAPYPGIIETLDALRNAGVHMAVLTNKDHAAAQPLVRRYFGNRIEVVQGHLAPYAPKPDPAITHVVLDALGASPAHTLYVGDSDVDVETGHLAGLAVAGAAWGFRGRGELTAAGADHLIDHPSELKALVL